ncbi:MAG: hypothetical protein GXD23_15110 [Comamonadaceae bacterium]|uniref:hypothetical protein n=1 Tax=Hydrogenophaga sp. PML113 TaxID=1899350 RepID=UPI0008784DBC|nr:hypothetical protein [Hydrogenophaga sp. PML113]NCT98694.1 hypothetical protein [Comamonadaceae bacterium]
MTHFQILAVLAPVSLLAMLVFKAALPALRRKLEVLEQQPYAVSRMREVAHDFSAIGSAAGTYFGYKETDILMFAFTLAWFIVFYTLANRYAKLEADLQERESAKAHRKMAGTVRGIAQSVFRAEFERRRRND